MLPVLAEASVTLPPLEIGSPPSPMATSHSTDSPHPHLSAPPVARCISHYKVPAPKDGLHLHRKPTPTSHCPFLTPIKLTELTAHTFGEGRSSPPVPTPPVLLLLTLSQQRPLPMVSVLDRGPMLCLFYLGRRTTGTPHLLPISSRPPISVSRCCQDPSLLHLPHPS